MPEGYPYDGPSSAQMLMGGGLWIGTGYLDNPMSGFGNRYLAPKGPLPTTAQGGFGVTQATPNPHYPKNLPKPGRLRSMANINTRPRQRLEDAYRKFRWEEAGKFADVWKKDGWGKAVGGLRGSLARQGVSTSNWTMARMGLGFIGRAAGIYFNATLAADVITGVAGFAVDSLIEIGKPRENRNRAYDSPAAATMRQSAVQAIQMAQLQTRSALGREANYIHQ